MVSTPVFRKKDGSLPDPEPVFLSSLIAPDIKRVADAAPQGFGRALTSYLSDPAPTSGRLDLRTADGRRRVLAGLHPARFPPARCHRQEASSGPAVRSQRNRCRASLRCEPGRSASRRRRRPVRGERAARYRQDDSAPRPDRIRRLDYLDRARRAAGAAETQARQVEDAARPVAESTAERLRRLEARQRADAARITRARDRWGASFPEDWPRLPEDDQELASPWSDDEWIKARTDVFLAALDLHRAFAAGAAWCFQQNLGHLVYALGRDPNGPPAEQELVAWQTLFLMIPVVSTTFASCGRMFARLGRESFGWLLVDEAGQALPQAAVGALWRSRRAVIVGDPRQLEPISQVPIAVQEKLRVLSRLPPHWLPASISAQGLADRRSVLGTQVATDDEPVWVGTPLRVHRRCEHPMFEMINDLAYGGLMVYGTAEQRYHKPALDPSFSKRPSARPRQAERAG